jgi:hypothetical protein
MHATSRGQSPSRLRCDLAKEQVDRQSQRSTDRESDEETCKSSREGVNANTDEGSRDAATENSQIPE